jgi:hypothetical protein
MAKASGERDGPAILHTLDERRRQDAGCRPGGGVMRVVRLPWQTRNYIRRGGVADLVPLTFGQAKLGGDKVHA